MRCRRGPWKGTPKYTRSTSKLHSRYHQVPSKCTKGVVSWLNRPHGSAFGFSLIDEVGDRFSEALDGAGTTSERYRASRRRACGCVGFGTPDRQRKGRSGPVILRGAGRVAFGTGESRSGTCFSRDP